MCNLSLLKQEILDLLQNKLHDGICNKRLSSTIATHDMSKIKLLAPDIKGEHYTFYTTNENLSIGLQ